MAEDEDVEIDNAILVFELVVPENLREVTLEILKKQFEATLAEYQKNLNERISNTAVHVEIHFTIQSMEDY